MMEGGPFSFSTRAYPLSFPLWPCPLSSLRGNELGVVAAAVPGVQGCMPPWIRGVLMLDATGGNNAGSPASVMAPAFSVSNTIICFAALPPSPPIAPPTPLSPVAPGLMLASSTCSGTGLTANDTGFSLLRGDIRTRDDLFGGISNMLRRESRVAEDDEKGQHAWQVSELKNRNKRNRTNAAAKVRQKTST